MSTWNLTHGSTTQSLAAWGLSDAVVTLASFAPSTLTFAHDTAFDAAPLFAYGDALTLLEGTTVRFKGRVRRLPCAAGSGSESRSYVAEDVLGDLNRRVFRQAWQMWTGVALVSTPHPSIVLFDNGSGGTLAMAAQLSDIIASAASIGVAVQMGTSAGMDITPRRADAKVLTYLEALKTVAKFAPDLCTQVDYTTTPPTLHFIRRINAAQHNLAVIDSAEQFTAEPLHNQRVNGVFIRYEKKTTVGEDVYNAAFNDAAPEGTTGAEENILVTSLELRGSTQPVSGAAQTTTQSQSLTVRTINPSSFDWWENLWPDLADRNEAATLTSGSTTDEDLDREIVTGMVPQWTGAAGEVVVSAVFNGVVNGQVYVNHLLQAKINATDLGSGTYTQLAETTGGGEGETPDPGEAVPSGIAASLYSALSVLHWTGSHTQVSSEPDWSIRIGDVVNFTGTDNAALTTARAQVQSVTYTLNSAARTLAYGAPPFLSFDDLIDLLHSQRTLSETTRSNERAGVPGGGSSGGGNTTVTGPRLGPGSSFIPTPLFTAVHPFLVRRIGITGNQFRVESGQFEGVSIPAETQSIGAARPRAIAIRNKWTLSKWAGQHVYGAVLKTGEDAPALASSTTVVDDVTVLNSGDEGWCVIAIIGSDNTVNQYARGNILAGVFDDGSLTAKATIEFSKNS